MQYIIITDEKKNSLNTEKRIFATDFMFIAPFSLIDSGKF